MKGPREVDVISSGRLRIGLLVDSFIQPSWIKAVIDEINSSSIAEIVLIVKNDALNTEKTRRYQRYWKNRHYLLFAAYNRFDEFKTKADPDAFEHVNVEPLLENIPVLSVEPLTTKFTDRLKTEDINKIKSYKLDVILRFGFRILKGEILKAASYGVWSFHHGDGAVNRGGPAGFWEVMEDEPVTGAMLQILTEQLDNGRVIAKSWSPTSDRFSARLNRNHYYWKVSAFVMRALRRIHEGKDLIEEPTYEPYSNRLYKQPTNAEMLRLGTRLTWRYLKSRARAVSQFNQWSLAYRFKTGEDDPNNAFYKFKFVIPSKDRFWADPFPAYVDGKYFVFVEEYVYERGKGHISVMELNRDAEYKTPVPVLERDYHLSYPCIFSWNGQFFMVPETSGNQTVELYRCVDFPGRWSLDTILIDNVNATDATVFEYNGKWWMFVNIGDRAYPTDWDELYLFFADTPTGPWQSHPQNPLKCDVRGSRPAGQVFEWQGNLYRPAQNSSRFYGYAMSVNKIKRLSSDEYLEEQVTTILPRWNKKVIGTHTLNSCGDLTVIDCLLKRNRF